MMETGLLVIFGFLGICLLLVLIFPTEEQRALNRENAKSRQLNRTHIDEEFGDNDITTVRPLDPTTPEGYALMESTDLL